MRIGFYGDSFCCEVSNPHSIAKGYDTYIKKLKNHFNAEIINLGEGGSSVWDVILKQFNKHDIPDVCIFCWTDFNRIYHSKIRNLTQGSLENKKWKDYSFMDIFHRSTINAAKEYFKHLHDYEKASIEQKAALQYFDFNVLSEVNSTIIHLWSFEKTYSWKQGIELTKPLIDYVEHNAKGFETWAANHIAGEENNQAVFESLRDSINAQRQPSS
jgi:hypothetical protein